MTSVGINIGTTTAQVNFNKPGQDRITLAGQVLRVENPSRKMLYESEIVFTPPVGSGDD